MAAATLPVPVCSLRMTSLPLDAFRHIRDLVIREIDVLTPGHNKYCSSTFCRKY
ncbi:unnamed protein product, partial [Staurois parvus]